MRYECGVLHILVIKVLKVDFLGELEQAVLNQ